MRAEDVDPILGHRLAGVTDGEGCFYISAPRVKGNYHCGFVIKMRADDRPLLERLREGCGNVGNLGTQVRHNEDWAPCVVWSVVDKAGVIFLRQVFARYPLWSKKQRDFEIWARAVDFWASVNTFRGGTDWTPMAEAKEELAVVRQYREPDEVAEFTDELAARREAKEAQRHAQEVLFRAA